MKFAPQTFAPADLVTVAVLILLEGLLSADNALVLAIMVKHLPKDQQKKALLYGLGGAFAFRLIAIIFATQVMQLWWLQALGAAYLLWVPLKHFFGKKHDTEVKTAGKSFWGTVIAVEITDIAFAIDSVLAGVALVKGDTGKIWVVYLGAIFGIILLRFAASFFIRLLERFPMLDHVAYAIVAWVGVKLTFLAAHTYDLVVMKDALHIPELPKPVFWSVLFLIAGVGTWIAVKNENKNAPELNDEADLVEDLVDLKDDTKEIPVKP